MKNLWRNFLGDDAGAEFVDDIVVHYGNPERELEIAVTGLVFTARTPPTSCRASSATISNRWMKATAS